MRHLTDFRAAADMAPADTSNPLVETRTVTLPRLHPRARAGLQAELLDAGFRTFRGVGVSPVARLTLGQVPTDDVAESVELDGRDGSGMRAVLVGGCP